MTLSGLYTRYTTHTTHSGGFQGGKEELSEQKPLIYSDR